MEEALPARTSAALRAPPPAKRGACLVAQVESAADIARADKLVFPGVGAFGQAMAVLQQRGYVQALKDYIQVGRLVGGGSAALVRRMVVNVWVVGGGGDLLCWEGGAP